MGNNYYFAKYKFDQDSLAKFDQSINTSDYEDVREQILGFIESNEIIHEEGNSEWRFGSSRLRDSDNFIVGRLGREFEDEPQSYNESTGEFESSKGIDADVSHFVLFFDMNIVAFNRKKRVGPKQFIRAFQTGFNRYYDTAPKMEMERLKNDISLEEVFNRADSVTRLEFSLEPTNPGPTEEMRKMDEEFRGTGADNFIIELFSDGGIETGAYVVSAAKAFVTNQYGDVKAWYRESGRSQQYNSRSQDAIYEGETEPEELEDVENEARGLKDQSKAVSDED